jgi:hypothetical protein
VFADGLGVACFLQLGETVSEVADARNDEFLRAMLYQHLSIHARVFVRGRWYLGRGHVRGRLDPFDSVANLLDGINERADVAGDVVE